MLLRLIVPIFICFTAFGSSDSLAPKKMIWPFEGLLGNFDRKAAQRGFQVYKEVCSACHALTHLSYRNLKDIGFSEDEIKAIAQEHQVEDGPNDQGEMFKRPAKPSDLITGPYPNEQAARFSNDGAHPPDLSLLIKARPDGANYVYSILTGYSETPKDFNLNPGLNYNPYFHGRQIAMPAPLSEGLLNYIDGTHASIDQMAQDVVIFLQWAAEPEMENRKSLGLKVMFFLVIFTVVSYIAKQRIWSRL